LGQDFRNFNITKYHGSYNILGTLMIIILIIVGIIVLYKLFTYVNDRRKWHWFLQLCKEKNMSPKEVLYLKSIVTRKKISNVDELFGAIYSLNLPTPIKKKLLWEDTAPSGTAPKSPRSGAPPSGTPRKVTR